MIANAVPRSPRQWFCGRCGACWYLVCQKLDRISSVRRGLPRRRSIVPIRKQTKAPPIMAEAEIAIVRIAPETSFKNKAYDALKEAILKMDIYATPEQVMLD